MMSRTYRTPSKTYYGNVTPVSGDERRQHLTPDTEHYRKRWFHGLDGGWRGGLAHLIHLDGLVCRYGWKERGHGRFNKKAVRRRINKAIRQAARHVLRDTGEPLE